MSSIDTVQAQVTGIVDGVVGLQATYTYPIAELGRKLPALVALYDGFTQARMAKTLHNLTWAYKFTVYLPADGKRLDTTWERLLEVVPAIIDAFRNNPSLNGVARDSLIESGEPIMHTPGTGPAQFVGHTFTLHVQVDAQ